MTTTKRALLSRKVVPAAPAPDPRGGTITDKAMLARLKISRWSASKHDRDISAKVARDHSADETMGRYTKRLIAKERLDVIRQIGTQARHHHYENTLPWLDDGARILPAASYFDYMQQQNAYRAQFEQAVEDFAKDYPDVMAAAKQSLGKLFNPDDYPPASMIRGKFGMQCDVDPIPDASDFRVQLSDAEQARIRESIQARLDTAVEGAVNDVWHRIHDHVAHMVERLQNYSVDKDGKVQNTFRDSLVENIRALADVLPKLNITNSNSLEDMRRRLVDDLCAIDAPTLRDDGKKRKAVAKKAEAILKEVESVMS